MLNREADQLEHVSRLLPRRAARMPTPRRHGHALLGALLASALAAASAQAPNDDYMSGEPVHVSTATIALLAAVIAVFLFIALSTVYLRHCTGGYDARPDLDGRAVHLDHHTFVSWSRRHQRRPRGLDPEVVETFPTMRYAEAKALRVGKGGALECAVCLSEFEDEERLRLLPKCSHAFHPDCIGQWLASHVTCPVCRCNLDPNKQDTSSDEDPPATQANSVSSETTSMRQDDSAQAVAIAIDVVTEEDDEERRREEVELQQIGSQRRAMRSRSGTLPPRLARAHSTGRSFAVRLDRDMERFTLRLPEHVRREMVAAGEHSLQSLRGRRAGEGSSRGGGRSGPIGGRAARWQSLLVRTFSGKVSFFSASRSTVSSDGGEVSSTSSSRARGKRVAAVDAADVQDRGGIRLDRIGGSPSGAKAGTVPHEAADEEKAVTQQVRT